jgi:hypothetical protein
MVSHRELEAVVAQVNAEFERLNNRIAELENARQEERPTTGKGRGKRIQQAEEDSEPSN